MGWRGRWICNVKTATHFFTFLLWTFFDLAKRKLVTAMTPPIKTMPKSTFCKSGYWGGGVGLLCVLSWSWVSVLSVWVLFSSWVAVASLSFSTLSHRVVSFSFNGAILSKRVAAVSFLVMMMSSTKAWTIWGFGPFALAMSLMVSDALFLMILDILFLNFLNLSFFFCLLFGLLAFQTLVLFGRVWFVLLLRDSPKER